MATTKKATVAPAKTATKPKTPAAKKVAKPAKVAVLEKPKKVTPKKGLSPKVFQIYFEDWQSKVIDPAFEPFDNQGQASELLEFDVFKRLAESDETKGVGLWGALSWRFTEKTGLTGKDLMAQIAANPGYDVYFCNPHVENEAVFQNMWQQGETSHPHFLALVKAVFKAAGLNDREINALHPSSSYSAANYFVATPKFWSAYIAFIEQVLLAVEKNLSPELLKVLHSGLADPKGLHAGATYVPFIVERLFGYFMRTVGKGLKPFKLVLPKREVEMNVHQKLLREMKNVAHQTKSPWMAACWVNYRNLYFGQTRTKTWCAKYLRTVTPTDISFV
jgi:hypothetical protein